MKLTIMHIKSRNNLKVNCTENVSNNNNKKYEIIYSCYYQMLTKKWAVIIIIGILNRAGSRHGQGWAKPTQMTVLPTQLELDVIFLCSD